MQWFIAEAPATPISKKISGLRLGLVWAFSIFILGTSLIPHLGIFLLSFAVVWSFSILPKAYTLNHYVEIFYRTPHFVMNTLLYCMLSAGIGVLLAVSCYLTVRQISFWRDEVTLWSRAIDLQPHFSGRMYFERAAAFEERGEFSRALQDMNEAITIAEMKHRPNMEELYFKRAQIHMQLGDNDSATRDYNYAMSLMSKKKTGN